MSKSCRSLVLIVYTITLLLALGVTMNNTASAAHSVELTIWVNSWPQKALDGIRKVATLFAQNHPMVKAVNVVPVPQEQQIERLTVTIAGGAPPDVVTLPAPFAQYALGGLLQPLDSFMTKSQQVRRADYPPAILESFSADSKIYGLPAIEVGPGMILYYNRDLFAENGLPDRGPSTLADLYQFHQKLTRINRITNQLTQLGIDPRDAMAGAYFPTIWSAVFNLHYFDTTTQHLNLLAFEPAVEFIKSILNTPSFAQVSQFSGQLGWWTASLASNKLGMQINGYWVPGELKALGSKSNIGYTWMPSVIGDKTTAILPWGMGIPANAKHPELSFQLIEFFTTPTAAQIMFDAVGWLNGNLTSMRGLDARNLPAIASIIRMLDEADRITAPLPLPIIGQINFAILVGGALDPAWRNEQSSRSVLSKLQDEMQQQLKKVLTAKQSATK